MTESIVALIAGAIVIWSLVVRYRTINTPEFTENTRLTIGIFAAFAVGLPMLNFEKTMEAFHRSTLLLGKDIGVVIVLASPLLLFPIFKILEGYSLSYSFARYSPYRLFDWFLDNFIAIIVAIFVLFFVYNSLSFDLQQGISQLTQIFLFVSFIITLGFIHSLLGSVIAGINIALIIAHFFTNGVFAFDLNNIFDLFEKVGISSTPLKWTIMVGSTTLGLQSYISFDNLKDMIRDI
jgi:hypothetical protein